MKVGQASQASEVIPSNFFQQIFKPASRHCSWSPISTCCSPAQFALCDCKIEKIEKKLLRKTRESREKFSQTNFLFASQLTKIIAKLINATTPNNKLLYFFQYFSDSGALVRFARAGTNGFWLREMFSWISCRREASDL